MKYLLLPILGLLLFSKTTFGITQGFSCSGTNSGDVVTTVILMTQVSYSDSVLLGETSSIGLDVFGTCTDFQYGSSPDISCDEYHFPGGVYGGAGVSSPVELNAVNDNFIQGSFLPNSIGNHEMNVYSSVLLVGGGDDGNGNCSEVFNYTVAPASTECSDNQPNDSDGLNDEADPQCHTDCNVNNAGSYVATHNSETTPPNGTCPTPPTLELNARAAFFQVVKNFIAFITTKAFAVTK